MCIRDSATRAHYKRLDLPKVLQRLRKDEKENFMLECYVRYCKYSVFIGKYIYIYIYPYKCCLFEFEIFQQFISSNIILAYCLYCNIYFKLSVMGFLRTSSLTRLFH